MYMAWGEQNESGQSTLLSLSASRVRMVCASQCACRPEAPSPLSVLAPAVFPHGRAWCQRLLPPWSEAGHPSTCARASAWRWSVAVASSWHLVDG